MKINGYPFLLNEIIKSNGIMRLEISFHSEFDIEFRDCPEPKTKIISDFFFKETFSNTSLVGFFVYLIGKVTKGTSKAQENLKISENTSCWIDNSTKEARFLNPNCNIF